MLTLAVAMLLNADPKFLSGAPATPLSEVGPVDETVSVLACTTETLRLSTHCYFDSTTKTATGVTEHAQQAKENVKAAMSVGQALCRSRAEHAQVDSMERTRRSTVCLRRLQESIAPRCALGGTEALLDAEGRFSTKARGCYLGLAELIQSTDVPSPPRDERPAPISPPSFLKPTSI